MQWHLQMWEVVITMSKPDDSHLDANLTCANGTCALPLEVAGEKWGLLALIVVILCTAVGNLLVCLAVCWERRLQNMTNYFLMSLAIADFLVSIIVMPFGMVVEIYGGYSSLISFLRSIFRNTFGMWSSRTLYGKNNFVWSMIIQISHHHHHHHHGTTTTIFIIIIIIKLTTTAITRWL